MSQGQLREGPGEVRDVQGAPSLRTALSLSPKGPGTPCVETLKGIFCHSFNGTWLRLDRHFGEGPEDIRQVLLRPKPF